MIAKTQASQTPFKKALLIAFAVLFSFGTVLLLGGCSNDSDQQRIAELEAEVDRLQNEQNATDQSQNFGDDTQSQDQSQATQTTYDDATVQDLSTRADDLISRAEVAEVPGDRDSRINSFFELDSEFNSFELEIDTYEDQKEAECRSGSLSWDDYRTLELQLEQIDERLGNAQDQLEVRFGIDDQVKLITSKQ